MDRHCSRCKYQNIELHFRFLATVTLNRLVVGDDTRFDGRIIMFFDRLPNGVT